MEQRNIVKSPIKKQESENISNFFEAKDEGLEMISKILMRIKKYLGDDWKKSRILYRGVSKDYTTEDNIKKLACLYCKPWFYLDSEGQCINYLIYLQTIIIITMQI